MNNVLGKILKINIKDKIKEKKENVKNKENKENIRKINTNIKNEEDLNLKINNTRNTYCEGDSKLFEKNKIIHQIQQMFQHHFQIQEIMKIIQQINNVIVNVIIDVFVIVVVVV